jgi:sugar lactone lactonase YvrE
VSRRAASIACLAAAALLVAPMTASARERPRWDTRVLALVPEPGFPARAYVHPNGRIYEGTYVNPLGDGQRSRVFEYTGRGTLLRSWTVPGQDLAAEHGVQVATSDARGRLLLLDRTPARALRLNTRNGRFRPYATFPDLAACPLGRVGPNCSPTLTNEPPVPNYAAWDRDGRLYVTDYLQGVIWRVPPGGGEARVWLADRRLDGNQFGTTGIVLAPDRRTLLVSQQSSAGLGGGNPTTGKLYAVRIRRDGRPGRLGVLWESGPLDGPDGFAVARSGNAYVTLAGSNQIVEVADDGTEVERFPSLPTGENGSSVPFDTPSSAMFLGRRLIVANQSFLTGDPAHQAILDVAVGERGAPELIPACAGVRRC